MEIVELFPRCDLNNYSVRSSENSSHLEKGREYKYKEREAQEREASEQTHTRSGAES